ncbi:hypothetical protein D3C86_1629530 [compost metagenome]
MSRTGNGAYRSRDVGSTSCNAGHDTGGNRCVGRYAGDPGSASRDVLGERCHVIRTGGRQGCFAACLDSRCTGNGDRQQGTRRNRLVLAREAIRQNLRIRLTLEDLGDRERPVQLRVLHVGPLIVGSPLATCGTHGVAGGGQRGTDFVVVDLGHDLFLLRVLKEGEP